MHGSEKEVTPAQIAETDDPRLENLDRAIGVLREMCTNIMHGRMSYRKTASCTRDRSKDLCRG